MLLAVVEIKAALIDRAVAMSSGLSSCMMGNHGNYGNQRKNRYQVACTVLFLLVHSDLSVSPIICRYFFTEYIQHDTSTYSVHTSQASQLSTLSFLSPQAKL